MYLGYDLSPFLCFGGTLTDALCGLLAMLEALLGIRFFCIDGRTAWNMYMVLCQVRGPMRLVQCQYMRNISTQL